MPDWIDTHCHLDAAEFADDRDAVYAAATAGGVASIVVPGVEVGGFAALRDCCRQYAGCQPAYGIHPLYVQRANPEDLVTLRRWIESEQPVAVGEIGLDFYVDGIDPYRQEFYLVEQLKIARDYDLPVLLHVRRAVDAVLRQLRRIGGRGIAHAFNGSRQQAEELIRRGFKLGVGGAMTFSGSRRIRELAATLPLEALVLETDSPDIPPEWLGGGRNTPDQLPRMAAVLAELRKVDVASVAAFTNAAAREIMPRLAGSFPGTPFESNPP